MGAGESKEGNKEATASEVATKKGATASEVATTVLAVGTSVVLAAGAIYSLLGSGSSDSVSSENENENENEKMMKAPGQNGLIIRRTDFEDNPKDYFRDLRKGK
ncbi:hypothetical protein CKAN_00415400 [Cinnamomum micranthum f. kanehirae]|uniref:Uncharacterized protein n=1 Tax=Cinnamomum micranthum f. kanehirae TaxID=337451 RepID=A0A3S4NDL8_9MAGN|nr:hypothetical protein CKAN_00415400 [Cinnamomum micranthum f. kanehirae]